MASAPSLSRLIRRQFARLMTTTPMAHGNSHLLKSQSMDCHRNWQASSKRTLMRVTESAEKREQRLLLVAHASELTRSLYRRCLRSIKVIRWGNDFDEMDFKKREEEFSNPTPGGRLSMAPPPNRDDELESRAEYYKSFARESFMNESDCLTNEPLIERDVKRFLYYIRKGEKDRKWLLGDMLFADPYKDASDATKINEFKTMAEKYLGHELEPKKEAPKKVSDDFWDDDEAESEDPFPHRR